MKVQSLVMAGGVLLAFSSRAADVAVGQWGNEEVRVESGSVSQTDSVWIDADGVVEKTGAGEWKVPETSFATEKPGVIDVLEGTLTLEKDGTAAAVAEPTAVMGKARLWLDATRNLLYTNGVPGKCISRWLDVRETKAAVPYDYPHGLAMRLLDPDNTKYPDSACAEASTVVQDAYGLDTAYFGGVHSGHWLRLVEPGADGSVAWAAGKGVCDIFVVHTVDKGFGYLLSGDKGRPFYTAEAGAVGQAIAAARTENYNSYQQVNFRRNGVTEDQQTSLVQKGCQLYEFEYQAEGLKSPEILTCLFNDTNINYTRSSNPLRHQGGDYLCEVLLFTNKLTEAERASVSRHLMSKWNIDVPEARVTVRTAKGSVLKAGSDGLFGRAGNVSLSGEGTLELSDDDAHFGVFQEEFGGAVSVPAGKTVHLRDAGIALAVESGTAVMAATDISGKKVSVAAGKSGEIAISASGTSVTLREIPSGTKKIGLSAGTLEFAPPTRETLSSGARKFATIDNASMEDVGDAGKGWSNANGSYGWKLSDADTSAWGVYFSRELCAQYHPDYLFVSPFAPPDGKYVLALHNWGSLENKVTIPEKGVYELSFYEVDSWKVSDTVHHRQTLQITLERDGASLPIIASLTGMSNGGYHLYRFRTPELNDGEYTLRFNSPRTEKSDLTCTFDVVKMRRLARPVRGCPVPNGGFETQDFDPARTSAGITNGVTATGWTFHHVLQWNTTAGQPYQPGVALVRLGTGIASSGEYPVVPSGFQTGHVQLMMASLSGSAETTFTPVSTGIRWLGARLSAYRGTFNKFNCYKELPAIAASVKIGDGPTIDLGTASPTGSRLEDVCWPIPFEVTDADVPLTLIISNTVLNAAAILDDFTLLTEADERGDLNLLKDSTCDGRGNWTLVYTQSKTDGDKTAYDWNWCHYKEIAQLRSEVGGINYGDDVLPDGGSTKNGYYVCDRGFIKQSVTFPCAGRYRLRYHVRGRYTTAESPQDKYCQGYAMKAYLAYGGVTNKIDEYSIGFSNFVARTAYFNVTDASHAYEFQIGDVNNPSETHVRDRSGYVDGISIVYAGESPSPAEMSFPDDIELNVAAGAKLGLGFAGQVRINKLKVAGRKLKGIVSAETYPDLVTGPGSFEVTGQYDKGMVILLR